MLEIVGAVGKSMLLEELRTSNDFVVISIEKHYRFADYETDITDLDELLLNIIPNSENKHKRYLAIYSNLILEDSIAYVREILQGIEKAREHSSNRATIIFFHR